uniref:Reverse transcriptase zinc-binding domain-containing protein n=2 Tax=Nicotiana TaxID=4085 RepID=A0A1S4BVG6_TOBAC|nr:PREDICTED: uncharacterized protein LOC104214123 [Nicotiana sylvestris]XP_016492859.1 PREDICTED: uncharacterized protein LOC107812313 [Nicotiana tabacum]
MHRKPATVDRLRKWGLSIASNCVLCRKDTEETMKHLFFACDYYRNMWAALLNGWEKDIKLVAGIYDLHVWAERNQRRFQGKMISSLQRMKNIILKLHIRGQNESKWHKELERLSNYPT